MFASQIEYALVYLPEHARAKRKEGKLMDSCMLVLDVYAKSRGELLLPNQDINWKL